MKLLRNLKRAKKDPKVDEKKWMNSELLTIQVPQHMVAKIQAKINHLYDEPEQDANEYRETTKSSRRTPSANRNTLGESSSKGKIKKFKKRKTREQNTAQDEANALFKMASESTKQELVIKLEEYRMINEQLARENEMLKQRLSQLQGIDDDYEEEDQRDSL